MIQNEPIASNRLYRVFLEDAAGNGVSGVSRAAGASIKLTKFAGSSNDTANDLVAVTGVAGAYTLQMNANEFDTPGAMFINILTNTFATPFRQFVIDDSVVPAEDCSRYCLAAGGAAGYVTLDSGASATNNYYAGNGQDVVVVILAGTGAGQMRLGTGYTGASRQLAVMPNWGTAPDATSVVKLFPYVGQLDAAQVTAIQSGLATTSALAAVATLIAAVPGAVWDALLASHVVAGSFGDLAQVSAGLLHDNALIDETSFDSAGLMLTARLRVFPSPMAASAAVPGHNDNVDGETYRFSIAAVASAPGRLGSYTLIREL